MPLHFAAPPANGTTLVQAGLNRLSTRTSPLSGRVVDFSTLELSQPHAVYDLRVNAVAAGGGLESATQTGFRYLVTGGGQTPLETQRCSRISTTDLSSKPLRRL
jgi:hypothetical protein